MNKPLVPNVFWVACRMLTNVADRVHRIGQSRRVRIRRFVVQDTVEERIQELQDKKRKLADGALQQQLAPHRDDDKDDKARERLNNLVSLFRAF